MYRISDLFQIHRKTHKVDEARLSYPIQDKYYTCVQNKYNLLLEITEKQQINIYAFDSAKLNKKQNKRTLFK